MRVIEPRQLPTFGRKRRKRLTKLRVFSLVLLQVLLAGVGAGVLRFKQPLPVPVATAAEPKYTQKKATFTWSEQGRAAVGAVGFGVLGASSEDEVPLPTASVAKVITALTVLDRKPLELNQPGETIIPTADDEAIYHKYLAMDGSVSGVTAGVGFSQYQALQALLLPSSNNMSETLTNWAFGSQEGYIQYANTYMDYLGLKHTTVADSSGFSPETMSTPTDLTMIGLIALDHPVIAEIVQQKTADIPGAGTIYNTNRLLGQSGINGIKTGNTNEAGGCYLVSSTQQYDNGKTVTVVAAIMAAPTLTDAMNQAKPLLAQVKAGFGDTVVATAGQQFGHIDTAWGGQSAAIVAKNDATAFGWLYATPKATITLTDGNYKPDQKVGTATIGFGDDTVDVELVQYGDLQPPSDMWRLLRR